MNTRNARARAVGPSRMWHLDETLDLLFVAVVRAKFSNPNGHARHLICHRGMILEVLDIVPVAVPVDGDEVDLAVSAGI